MNLRLVLLFLVGSALLIGGCRTNPPRQNVPQSSAPQLQWNCGDPSASVLIDANGSQITAMRVNWGRTTAPQTPQVYALDTLGEGWPDGSYSLQRRNRQTVTLPADGSILVGLRFSFRERMAAGETLKANLFVLYDDGSGVRTHVVRLPNLVSDEQSFRGCSGAIGTTVPPDRPVGVGSAGAADCPVPAAPDGGLAAPTLDPDPGAAQGPQPGASCAGNPFPPGTGTTAVPFSWNEVDGAARDAKAYQIEVINADQGAAAATSCLEEWSPDGTALDNGSRNDCIIADTDTESYSRLLSTKTDYTWRARATCTADTGERRVGPFSPPIPFQTRGEAEKVELRTPAADAVIRTQARSLTVRFEWKALDCGASEYHLIGIGSADLPPAGKPLDPEDLPTEFSSRTRAAPQLINGEMIVSTTAGVPSDDTYGWYVYAVTPQGTTQLLSAEDVRTLTVTRTER